MATATSLLTSAEFLALPEPEGQRIELLEGELIVMARGGKRHEIVKSNPHDLLAVYKVTHPHIRVLSETIYALPGDSDVIPDVSVILVERLNRVESNLINIAPDLAIEVVSSESAEHLMHKVRVYLKHGTRAVWILYPADRCVQVFDANGGSRMLEADAVLEEPDLLPDFRVRVEDFFSGI